MKRLLLLLCLVSALPASCATPGGLPPLPGPPCDANDVNCWPPPGRKFGDVETSPQGRWVCGSQRGQTAGPSCPVVQGNTATVVVFSTTSQADSQRGMYPGIQRVFPHLRFNQPVTVLYQTLAQGSSTWRTMNGAGSGDSLAANTDYAVDFLVMGPDVRIAVTTGATGPTSQEESVQVFFTRELGQ